MGTLCLANINDGNPKHIMSLNANSDRVLFHYNGHGVPKPTANGEIWVFNKVIWNQYNLVPIGSSGLALSDAYWTSGSNKIRLWNKGVDSESFYPKYRSQEMRIRLSNGEPERPLIVHVGRLGVEKSLDLLKSHGLDTGGTNCFYWRWTIQGLEKLFSGMPAVFTGMLGGEELSQAYASGDVFVMPSESETLGHIMSFSENRLKLNLAVGPVSIATSFR
ncbi:unnamed protein product [Camellia sinensis]